MDRRVEAIDSEENNSWNQVGGCSWRQVHFHVWSSGFCLSSFGMDTLWKCSAPWCGYLPGESCSPMACHQMGFENGNLIYLQVILEFQTGLGWERPRGSSHSSPLPQAGRASTRPGFFRATFVKIEYFLHKIQFCRVPKLIEKLGPAPNPWNHSFWCFSIRFLALNSVFLFWEVVCAFLQDLSVSLAIWEEKSACKLSFHLKNSPKIPLLCLSPFPIEAGACPPRHLKLKGALKQRF